MVDAWMPYQKQKRNFAKVASTATHDCAQIVLGEISREVGAFPKDQNPPAVGDRLALQSSCCFLPPLIDDCFLQFRLLSQSSCNPLSFASPFTKGLYWKQKRNKEMQRGWWRKDKLGKGTFYIFLFCEFSFWKVWWGVKPSHPAPA